MTQCYNKAFLCFPQGDICITYVKFCRSTIAYVINKLFFSPFPTVSPLPIQLCIAWERNIFSNYNKGLFSAGMYGRNWYARQEFYTYITTKKKKSIDVYIISQLRDTRGCLTPKSHVAFHLAVHSLSPNGCQ